MKVLNAHGKAFHNNASSQYVGRPHILGNPFKIGPDGNRTEVIAKYKRYFWERVNTDEEFLTAALDVAGKDLWCWCAPLACHADVIVAWHKAGCPLKEVSDG